MCASKRLCINSACQSTRMYTTYTYILCIYFILYYTRSVFKLTQIVRQDNIKRAREYKCVYRHVMHDDRSAAASPREHAKCSADSTGYIYNKGHLYVHNVTRSCIEHAYFKCDKNMLNYIYTYPHKQRGVCVCLCMRGKVSTPHDIRSATTSASQFRLACGIHVHLS